MNIVVLAWTTPPETPAVWIFTAPTESGPEVLILTSTITDGNDGRDLTRSTAPRQYPR